MDEKKNTGIVIKEDNPSLPHEATSERLFGEAS